MFMEVKSDFPITNQLGNLALVAIYKIRKILCDFDNELSCLNRSYDKSREKNLTSDEKKRSPISNRLHQIANTDPEITNTTQNLQTVYSGSPSRPSSRFMRQKNSLLIGDQRPLSTSHMISSSNVELPPQPFLTSTKSSNSKNDSNVLSTCYSARAQIMEIQDELYRVTDQSVATLLRYFFLGAESVAGNNYSIDSGRHSNSVSNTSPMTTEKKLVYNPFPFISSVPLTRTPIASKGKNAEESINVNIDRRRSLRKRPLQFDQHSRRDYSNPSKLRGPKRYCNPPLQLETLLPRKGSADSETSAGSSATQSLGTTALVDFRKCIRNLSRSNAPLSAFSSSPSSTAESCPGLSSRMLPTNGVEAKEEKSSSYISRYTSNLIEASNASYRQIKDTIQCDVPPTAQLADERVSPELFLATMSKLKAQGFSENQMFELYKSNGLRSLPNYFYFKGDAVNFVYNASSNLRINFSLKFDEEMVFSVVISILIERIHTTSSRSISSSLSRDSNEPSNSSSCSPKQQLSSQLKELNQFNQISECFHELNRAKMIIAAQRWQQRVLYFTPEFTSQFKIIFDAVLEFFDIPNPLPRIIPRRGRGQCGRGRRRPPPETIISLILKCIKEGPCDDTAEERIYKELRFLAAQDFPLYFQHDAQRDITRYRNLKIGLDLPLQTLEDLVFGALIAGLLSIPAIQQFDYYKNDIQSLIDKPKLLQAAKKYKIRALRTAEEYRNEVISAINTALSFCELPECIEEITTHDEKE